MLKGKPKQARRDFLRGIGVLTAGLFLPECSVPVKEALSTEKKTSLHKILACNIRVALPEDEEKGVGWNARKEICANIIRKQNPDIVCFQEVIKIQADDLRNFFPDFVFFGFEGPEMDKLPEGYHGIAKNPIMFSRVRYEVVSGGCFWLSEEPLIGGSKSWGTARARNVNWVRLRDINTLKEFRVVNTHLDHISQEAREKQIDTILMESDQYLVEFPQLLAGDFNSDSRNAVVKRIVDQGWNDTWTSVHGTINPGFTGHGFLALEKATKTGGNGKIDFIFSRGNIIARKAEIIRDKENGIYPSDHFFVSAEVVLV